MQYIADNNSYIIKIEQGESVIEILTAFCTEHGIANASFTALGAVDYARCGYYALAEQKYYFTEYDALVEVASATGNVILKDGAPFVHLHAVFTDTENRAYGGHVEEMRVGVTLEVSLQKLNTNAARTLEKHIGLCLINPS